MSRCTVALEKAGFRRQEVEKDVGSIFRITAHVFGGVIVASGMRKNEPVPWNLFTERAQNDGDRCCCYSSPSQCWIIQRDKAPRTSSAGGFARVRDGLDSWSLHSRSEVSDEDTVVPFTIASIRATGVAGGDVAYAAWERLVRWSWDRNWLRAHDYVGLDYEPPWGNVISSYDLAT